MDLLVFALLAVCAVAVLTVILFLILGKKKDAYRRFTGRVRRPRGRKTDGDVCGICFGMISKGDMVARCGCGQLFHDACAEPTGMCPYCRSSYDDLAVESPDCVICPSCGSDVVGNVCGCGAVVNRGGAFTCECGTPLNIDDPVCRRCGKEYDVRSGKR
ncbi:MAG: hypothetical protein LBV13_06430 [Methanomassiliicoccaceae archaeon]|jgi:hypothetical protein|nr:hypothetical protein [Methanomassiliicoccaceae archaeon]